MSVTIHTSGDAWPMAFYILGNSFRDILFVSLDGIAFQNGTYS